MRWERIRPGWYEGRDANGTLWRIVQAASQRWEVIRPGVGVDCDWVTLADSKWWVENGGWDGHRARKARRLARIAARVQTTNREDGNES